jgi:hypothetical protein
VHPVLQHQRTIVGELAFELPNVLDAKLASISATETAQP